MKINKGQVRRLYNILFVPILIVFLVVTEWEPFVEIGALPYTLLLEDGWKQADKRHSQERTAFLKAATEDWISENRAVLEIKVSEKVESLFSDLEDSAAAYREFRDGFDQSFAAEIAELDKEREKLLSETRSFNKYERLRLNAEAINREKSAYDSSPSAEALAVSFLALQATSWRSNWDYKNALSAMESDGNLEFVSVKTEEQEDPIWERTISLSSRHKPYLNQSMEEDERLYAFVVGRLSDSIWRESIQQKHFDYILGLDSQSAIPYEAYKKSQLPGMLGPALDMYWA